MLAGRDAALLLLTCTVASCHGYMAMLLSAFFGPIAVSNFAMSETAIGLIYAAYPAGVGLASIMAVTVGSRFRARFVIVCGTLVTSTLSTCFSFAPDVAPMPFLPWLLVAIQFANGIFGSSASIACTRQCVAAFPHRPSISSSIRLVETVATVVAPLVGGVACEAAHGLWGNEAPARRLPSLLQAVLSAAMLPIALYVPLSTLPSRSQRVFDRDFCAPGPSRLVSVGLARTFVSSLNLTLSFRLAAPPFRMGSSMIGLYLTASLLPWCLVSPLARRITLCTESKSSVRCTLARACGFFLIGSGFALLAPAPVASMHSSMNTEGWILAGVLLLGSGYGLVDPLGSRSLAPSGQGSCANAHGILGAAVGPVLGGALYEMLVKSNRLCLATEALATCGSTVCNQMGQCAAKLPEACSCEWSPTNGFDGYCLAIVSFSWSCSLVLFLAAGRSMKSCTWRLGVLGYGRMTSDSESKPAAPATIKAAIDTQRGLGEEEETEPIISF